MAEASPPTRFHIPYQRFLNEVEAVALRATLSLDAGGAGAIEAQRRSNPDLHWIA